MAAFGTIKREDAIKRTSAAPTRGSNDPALLPYLEAVKALLQDVDESAGTLTLGTDDKLSKERMRLRAAYKRALKLEGMNLPEHTLVVKRSGSEVLFYIDKDAPAPAPRAPRNVNAATAPAQTAPSEQTANGTTAPSANGAAREPVTAAAKGGKSSRSDDVEL